MQSLFFDLCIRAERNRTFPDYSYTLHGYQSLLHYKHRQSSCNLPQKSCISDPGLENCRFLSARPSFGERDDGGDYNTDVDNDDDAIAGSELLHHATKVNIFK